MIEKLMSVFNYIYRKAFIKRLIKGGASVGKHSKIYDPLHSKIDMSRPWLLKIGDYTLITSGVTILTHDYSLSTIRRVYGEWIGEGAEVVIGDNCFIGMNATLLMGTRLGNNVIVGAGSVVHGKFPDNVVLAGNPAKVICTLEEHYHRRKEKTIYEAIECVQVYYKRMGKYPKPKELENFKFLFCPRDEKTVRQYGFNFNCSGDNVKEVEEEFYNSKPFWKNYDDFLSAAGIVLDSTGKEAD